MVDAPRSEERKINTTQTAIRNLFLQRRDASGASSFHSLFYSFAACHPHVSQGLFGVSPEISEKGEQSGLMAGTGQLPGAVK